MSRHGGKLLVDQLSVHGADTVFSVPGESFLAVLDGFYESPIRLITCRHEAGAANMADAYGKLTGRPGICIVTRGPGATQASVGVGGARVFPGGRLPADVRAAGEVGRSDRPR